MPYQGRQPGVGVRNRFIFIATSGQTSFSGADSNGLTLKYPDATYTDVFLNGVLLIPVTDYAATNNTSVVLSSGAGTSDVVEIVAYDISSIANTVPVSGGTFTGPVTVGGTLDVTGTTTVDALTATGAFTSLGIDDNATSTAMTLDASGNLLVGKTASDFNTQGFEINSGGQLRNSRASGAVAFLNRKTNDGSIVEFGKDGSVVGNIGNAGTDVYFRKASGAGVYCSSTAVLPFGAHSLGQASDRWSDLYLSGGVYLGGTGAANKLDDYEEGAWTPTTNGDATGALGAAEGRYVKVGQKVTVWAQFRVTSSFTANSIGGLPFTVGNLFTISSLASSGVAITSSADVTTSVTETSTTIGFFLNGDVGTSHPPNTGANVYRLCLSYLVA